jgi:hypothetical protein
MKLAISAAVLAAALAFAAPQVLAADDATSTEKPGDPAANTGTVTPPAGAETSDRTPDKTTPTPDTQVDKTKEGATSNRTPEKGGEQPK